MSFDGAKVRRFFGLRKRLRQIVCVNSLFVDAYQINAEIRNFSYFLCKVALISGKMRTFVPQINILYIIKVYGREEEQVHVGGLPVVQHR